MFKADKSSMKKNLDIPFSSNRNALGSVAKCFYSKHGAPVKTWESAWVS